VWGRGDGNKSTYKSHEEGALTMSIVRPDISPITERKLLSTKFFQFLNATLNILVIVAITTLSGCLSMPISTMVKMARYDVDDYLRMDPGVIRMRITSDSDDPLIIERTKLTVKIFTQWDEVTTSLGGALVVESTQDLEPERGFFTIGYQPEHIYVLKFDDQAINSFNKLEQMFTKRFEEIEKLKKQGLYVKPDKQGNLTLGADYDFRDKKPATLKIEVLLNKRDGYFTLINKVKFSPEIDS
jgi:hypothetical protein